MKHFVLGIAGGSGTGKTTLAFNLKKQFPGLVLIDHMDDYFTPPEQVPVEDGYQNWDHPQAVLSDLMAADLAELKKGRPVIINTKSPEHNPDFYETFQRIPVEFSPKPLIIVEGYLALHFPEIREQLDYSIYLDAPFDLHTGRRVHSELHGFPADYHEKILKPMHYQYVDASKQHADKIIDVSELNPGQVLAVVTELLPAELTTV